MFGSDKDVVAMLAGNPSLALMCQSLKHQARGDRDPEYIDALFGPVAKQ